MMSQKQRAPILNLDGELRAERANYLHFTQLVTVIVTALALVICIGLWQNEAPIDMRGFAILGTALLLTYIALKRENVDTAAHLYLVGLTLFFAFQISQVGPVPAFYILMIVPVVLASALVNNSDVPWVTGFVTFAAFAGTALNSNIASAFAYTLIPGLTYAAVGSITFIKNLDTLERMRWTLDIQQKDTNRAEHFYDQSEELQKALLQVQHYSSRLEQVNKQLAVAQEKAETASKAKSTFLSNMSHELRTPLNVIIGYSSSMLNMPQMFQNKKVSPAHRPYLELIEENGHYLLGLINDTLDLSKIEAGKLDLHCEATSLPDIFRGVLATSTGLLKGKPIQLRSNFPDDLPRAWADPMRVRQIILNLMSNAVKFTESGSITLAAATKASCIEITVTDTGIGIPEKALAVIFDRFQQAEKDTDRKYGGTGLGLDISKQLCLMHGGDLTVSSEAGRGSIFTITLPIAPEQTQGETAPQDDGTNSVDFTQTQAATEADPQLVLLVEDDVNTRQLLRQSLESAGHVVVDTSSGTEAMELAEGLLPAVIILDVFLPDANGWQLLKQLRENTETSPIPVIVCSAAEDMPDGVRELQPMYYLPKPLTPELVLDFVDEALAANKIEVEKQL